MHTAYTFLSLFCFLVVVICVASLMVIGIFKAAKRIGYVIPDNDNQPIYRKVH